MVWRVPLGGFDFEAWGAAEAVLAEVAMDPDFRLEALSFSPGLKMPFRTRTAFSSA